jgi:hypothetical protein
LSIVSPIGAALKRPSPPADLPARAAAEWRAIVSSESAEVFQTAAAKALLRRLCAHLLDAWRLDLLLAQWADADEVGDLGEYERLLKMRDRETRAAAALARALRLTNQSRYSAERAATAARNRVDGKRPWE